jgi:hypothetical protein
MKELEENSPAVKSLAFAAMDAAVEKNLSGFTVDADITIDGKIVRLKIKVNLCIIEGVQKEVG